MSEIDEAELANCYNCNWESDIDDFREVAVGRRDAQLMCDSCEDSLYTCVVCSLRFWDEDVITCDNDYFCGDCADTSLECCDECSDYYLSGESCGCRPRGIHYYSYKPSGVFFSVSGGLLDTNSEGYQGGGLYIGAELETESIEELSDAVDCFRGSELFYLKDDCSLSNGFEIVSHPATVEAWRFMLPSYTDVFNNATDVGLRAWGRRSCGLHFHLSRCAFTPAHLMRFHKFIMENADTMKKFAGRDSEDYASFTDDSGKASDRAKGQSQSRRNCAINYHNYHTVELRFFRPTLNPAAFLGIVEFVGAVFDYTKLIRSSDLVGGVFPFAGFSDWLDVSDYSLALQRVSLRLGGL